jgi:hypothetical protein
VPTDAAAATVRRHAARVVEIGCGSGYWAFVLAQAGVDVLAFDAAAPRFAWHPVAVGGPEAAARHPDRALLLCWPPYGSPMARDALACYRGDAVIYVGEWPGGCAESGFFARLAAEFDAVDGCTIPQWFARSDSLTVFRRRAP